MSETIEIEKIIVDDIVRIREEMNMERIREFMDILDQLPPVDVIRTTDGQYFLADGLHRREAAIAKSKKTLECEVKDGDLKDALEVAIKRNSKSSLPLTRIEKRHAVEKILKFFPNRANSWIAEIVGVSMQLVDSVRENLEEKNVIQIVEKFETRDGREYPRETKKFEPPVPQQQSDSQPPRKPMTSDLGRRIAEAQAMPSASAQRPTPSAIPTSLNSPDEDPNLNDALSKEIQARLPKSTGEMVFIDTTEGDVVSKYISGDEGMAVRLKATAGANEFEIVLYSLQGERFYRKSGIKIPKDELLKMVESLK